MFRYTPTFSPQVKMLFVIFRHLYTYFHLFSCIHRKNEIMSERMIENWTLIFGCKKAFQVCDFDFVPND